MNATLITALAAVFAATAIAQDVKKDTPKKEDPKKEEARPAAPADTAVKHVDAAGAKAVLDEGAKKKDAAVTVLDIRTPEEFAEGHIKGAKNIDFRGKTFADDLAKLDRSKTYLVHCAGGRRSTTSLETFKKLGFKAIVHLDGGLTAWEKAGNQLTK